MKRKRGSAFCGAGSAVVLWIILLSILFLLFHVKVGLTELGRLLHSQHDAYRQSVLDLNTRISSLDEAVFASCDTTASALHRYESRQRSMNGKLDILNRQLLPDLARDIAVLRNSHVGIVRAVGEAGPLEAQDDLFVQSLFRKGSECFSEERYGQAAACMSELLSRVPDYREARLIYAAARYRENPLDSGRRKEIKADLSAVLSEDPHNILALESLGSIALEEQEWMQARRLYRRLIELDKSTIDYFRMFVLACRENDAIQDAAEEIAVLLEHDPDDPLNLLYRGEVLEQQKDYSRAFIYFQESLTRDSGCVPAIMGAVRSAMHTGQYRRAKELLGSPALPGNYETFTLLAECSENLGEGDKAIIWWNKAAASLTLNTPSDREKAAACFLNAARSAYGIADYDGVLSAAEKGLSFQDETALRLIRAKALLKTGRAGEAHKELSLVSHSDGDPDLRAVAVKLLTDPESIDG